MKKKYTVPVEQKCSNCKYYSSEDCKHPRGQDCNLFTNSLFEGRVTEVPNTTSELSDLQIVAIEYVGDFADHTNAKKIRDAFIAGAKSPEAKELHTKGMYSEDELQEQLSRNTSEITNIVLKRCRRDMYSEEEVIELVTKAMKYSSYSGEMNAEEWFNQNIK